MSQQRPINFVLALHTDHCKHCGKQFTEYDLVYAVGEPYSMLLHEACAPYYNYNQIFPHQKPLSAYRKI